MRRVRILFLCLASYVASSWLLPSARGRLDAAEGAGDLPPALVVVEGARDVVRNLPKEELDPVSVSYEVTASYPASAVLGEIRGKLESAGWRPLPRESLGAIHPSSLRVGWRTHISAFRGTDEETRSFAWNALWRNSAGDVVAFTLTYRTKTVSPESQPAKPDNDSLHVEATLSRNLLLRLEGLPEALIVLDGAGDTTAWRFKDEQRLGYDLLAPRPPSEVMAALGERLEKLGWTSVSEPPPPWRPESDWAKSHKPGWNFGASRGSDSRLEWRSTWQNTAGGSVRYVFSYAAVLPAGATEDPEHGVTHYYVEANYHASGKPNFILLFPSARSPIKPE
ncbi:MAG TPA: hypothetical protein VKG01_13390 [Thermoanaerobaculia bacterium]|nr:hypothetical protein [Thermoanaerobaculia bacterium]